MTINTILLYIRDSKSSIRQDISFVYLKFYYFEAQKYSTNVFPSTNITNTENFLEYKKSARPVIKQRLFPQIWAKVLSGLVFTRDLSISMTYTSAVSISWSTEFLYFLSRKWLTNQRYTYSTCLCHYTRAYVASENQALPSWLHTCMKDIIFINAAVETKICWCVMMVYYKHSTTLSGGLQLNGLLI